jgi:phosphoserine phosphatase
MCETMSWACAGWLRGEVESFARRVIEENVLSTRLHAEVVRVLEWARARDVACFLVSASPREVVEAAAELVDVPKERVVAATAVYDGETMRAEVHRPIPYGPGKVRGLKAKLEGSSLVAAFGDNGFDVALRGSAAVPVAVRPKQRLRDRAAEVAGLLEIVA